jgi:hypothetical protein
VPSSNGAPNSSTVVATEMFASAHRLIDVQVGPDSSLLGQSRQLCLTDVMDSLSTRVYRILLSATGGAPGPVPPALPTVTTDLNATELLFNPGFEFCTSVGSADGFWAAWGGDKSATNLVVSDVVHSGMHAMRLRTPGAASGLRLWSFPIKAKLLEGAMYTVSLWARGGDNAQTLHVGMEALFGSNETQCPMDAGTGQCSYVSQCRIHLEPIHSAESIF